MSCLCAVARVKRTVWVQAIAAAKTRWPTDGGAAVFIPRARLMEAENGTVVLGFDDVLKGGSAGVARDLLQAILQDTLKIYPPKPRYGILA